MSPFQRLLLEARQQDVGVLSCCPEGTPRFEFTRKIEIDEGYFFDPSSNRYWCVSFKLTTKYIYYWIIHCLKYEAYQYK